MKYTLKKSVSISGSLQTCQLGLSCIYQISWRPFKNNEKINISM